MPYAIHAVVLSVRPCPNADSLPSHIMPRNNHLSSLAPKTSSEVLDTQAQLSLLLAGELISSANNKWISLPHSRNDGKGGGGEDINHGRVIEVGIPAHSTLVLRH